MDLRRTEERRIYDFLLRQSTGRWPRWRLLAIQRVPGRLLIAIEWRRDRSGLPFSRLDVSLRDLHLRWHNFATAREARQALRL